MKDAIATHVPRLWRASRPLTAVGLGMLVVFVLSLAGVALDPRVITGAPAWLKPAKFAISTAIYALTLAWLFTICRTGRAWCAASAGRRRRSWSSKSRSSTPRRRAA